MSKFAAALSLTLALVGAQPLMAQKTGTVVELYTSQGCSSCPPADAILADLAKRDDVIALALHVDYWDYIGWVDDLANPAYTRRQQAYASARGSDTVYTPQMVIDGQDHVIGSRPMQVMDQIQRHAARPDPVSLSVTRRGSSLQIAAPAANGLRTDAVIQVVRYIPAVTRDIHRGENAGKRITYVNTVTDWDVVGRWNTGGALDLSVPVTGNAHVAVIVQQGTNGPILGAMALE